MEKPWVRGPPLAKRSPVWALEAVPDQPEQGLDAVVEVVAVQRLFAGQAHHLQVAQPLQAVALAVRLRLDRRVAEVRVAPRCRTGTAAGTYSAGPGEPEFVRHRFIVAGGRRGPSQPRAGSGSSRCRSARWDSRSAYFRSSETANACLWLLSSRLSSRLAPCSGSRHVAVQQGGGGLQRMVLAAPEDVVEVEAEQPVVGPLAALDAGST